MKSRFFIVVARLKEWEISTFRDGPSLEISEARYWIRPDKSFRSRTPSIAYVSKGQIGETVCRYRRLTTPLTMEVTMKDPSDS